VSPRPAFRYDTFTVIARQLECGTDTAMIAAVCTAAALGGHRISATPNQVAIRACRM
jgi:hypothetical protein